MWWVWRVLWVSYASLSRAWNEQSETHETHETHHLSEEELRRKHYDQRRRARAKSSTTYALLDKDGPGGATNTSGPGHGGTISMSEGSRADRREHHAESPAKPTLLMPFD
jgi:hypothetical protein